MPGTILCLKTYRGRFAAMTIKVFPEDFSTGVQADVTVWDDPVS